METHPASAEYAGAQVNCWLQRESQAEAEAVAREWINSEHWRITKFLEATVITRETQLPGGMCHFEQAEIDGEVFLFHTWPVGAADDSVA